MSAPDDATPAADAPEAYADLLDRFRRYSYLEEAGGVLGWDQQVVMPEGGAPARARQLSAVSTAAHDVLADEATGDLLASLADADLGDERAAVVREIRRQYEREAGVPASLVEELTTVQSENQRVWRRARAEDEFEAFAPRLERLREVTRERAAHVDPDAPPYEVMYEDGEPYLPLETVERVFDRLREELPPMVETIRAEGSEPAAPFDGDYPEADQRALCEAALEFLGYDFERGRLDTAPHPFMSGTQFDARVTTRFDPADPLDALTATIHEYGHASYQLGLRKDAHGTPLGQPRSSGVHESQSRFWENHVGRTRPFWEAFLPTLREHLDGHDDLTAAEAYEAVNRIYPENLIRVEADELTYHMHVLLRCEIDRAFVAGDLPVEEIPAAWNERMDDYLGVRPETDAEGCLQDIHWSYGFAGFQSYTVGSVLAAQLDATIREDLDVDGLVREGEFDPIREWMGERIHEPGQRYTTDELIEHATGEPLTADYFLAYAREKFSELYGVSL
jgi:carboxypeptidase Taq